MKLLLLDGYGIDMRVDGGKLHIKEGRSSPDEEPEEYTFAPKRIDIDNIVIYGRKGNITLVHRFLIDDIISYNNPTRNLFFLF
jgi:CRISPR-associated protein Cas1